MHPVTKRNNSTKLKNRKCCKSKHHSLIGAAQATQSTSNLEAKLDALMESAAAVMALASPDAAYQTRDKEAQNTTQKRNFTGFSSKEGKISSSLLASSVSRNQFEEALVLVKGRGKCSRS